MSIVFETDLVLSYPTYSPTKAMQRSLIYLHKILSYENKF